MNRAVEQAHAAARPRRQCAWTGAWVEDAQPVDLPHFSLSGRVDGYWRAWVQPQHRAALLAHAESARRRARPGLLLALAVSLSFPLLAALAGSAGVGIGFIALGASVAVFGCMTTETVATFGVRPALRIMRAVSALLVIGGLVLAGVSRIVAG